MSNARMFWIHSLTPLHVGAGQGVGFIDLPIMREKVTNWPVIPGSSVKGVLRDYHETRGEKNEFFRAGFGMEGKDGQAGSLVFTDAHMAFLPVRSLFGTFAYVTSPLALRRLKRDLEHTEHTGHSELPNVPMVDQDQILCTEGSAVKSGDKVYLEEFDFRGAESEDFSHWARFFSDELFKSDPDWGNVFRERLVCIHDDVFSFLTEHATEVAARVRIENETKSVASGALWYEESLPAETVLGGVLWSDRVPGGKFTQKAILEHFFQVGRPLDVQMGGHATVGKGRVRMTFTGGEE